MATYEVGIAVNGTVPIEVDADDEAAAEDAAVKKFFEDFEGNVARVGSKACSAETIERLDGED